MVVGEAYLLESREVLVGIFSYFAQIDEDGSGFLDIDEVRRMF